MYRKSVSIFLGLALMGCSQAPAPQERTDTASAGVNILAPAVLAAEKILPTTQTAPDDRPDLIQAIEQSPENHQEVLRALRLAGLVPLLQEVGPYTILAPTDEAFDKLPPGTMARLEQPDNRAQLLALLQYHILKGSVPFKALVDTNGQIPTLARTRVVVKGVDGKVMANDANIIHSDSTASNGMIHWLDTVLLPPVS